MPKINDLDLKNWKEYGDILTDSLWSIDERDRSGAHNNAYHGNFIPQIPNQIQSSAYQQLIQSFYSFNQTNNGRCNRLKFIEFDLVGNDLYFSIVPY